MDKEHKNALPIGYQLQEYRIEEVLGAGAFGITYKALDNNLGQYVAIKEYLPNSCACREGQTSVVAKSTHDEKAYQWGLTRFADEGRNLVQCKHPNIVRVLRFFAANNTAYLVMEYEEGQTLNQYLTRLNRRLTEAEVLGIFLPLLDGLSAVHKAGLLHRDIKPDNIFLRSHNSPMLIDFGAARYSVGDETKTLTELLTPAFAPLEQYANSGKNQGAWTDVYALGACLYFCVCGSKPVDSSLRSMVLTEDGLDPYVSIKNQRLDYVYSPSFLSAIDSALTLRIQDRLQTAKDLQSLLTQVYSDGDKTVRFEDFQKSLPKPEPKVKWQTALLSLAGLSMLAVAGALAYEKLNDKTPQSGEDKPLIVSAPVGTAVKPVVDDASKVAPVTDTPKTDEQGLAEKVLVSSLQKKDAAEKAKQKAKEAEAERLAKEEAARLERELAGEMVEITGGCFDMGSPTSETERNDDERQHNVCVGDFHLGKYEVTQSQWQAVMGSNPSHFKGDDLPVETVNWNDVQTFIEKLNVKTGKQYRLPTEAEWEYAARAGTTTPFYTDDCINTSQANYDGNYDYNDCGAKTGVYKSKTVAVGSYSANPWGLHDMAGNVWEWTCSEYAKDYDGSEQHCAGKNNAMRPPVIRGGSWFGDPGGLRSAYRFSITGGPRYFTLGFRLVRM